MCWMSLRAQIEMDTFANLTSVSLCPSLCRSTDHWRWRKKASRHATARCPASPSGTRERPRASTSSPSACMTRRCLSVALLEPWLPTCPTWATCLLSATQATCCPRRPPSTQRSATRITRVARPSGLSLTEDPWNQQTFLFDLHQWGFFFTQTPRSGKRTLFLFINPPVPKSQTWRERSEDSCCFEHFFISYWVTLVLPGKTGCVLEQSHCVCVCTRLMCMYGFGTLNQRKKYKKRKIVSFKMPNMLGYTHATDCLWAHSMDMTSKQTDVYKAWLLLSLLL